MPATAIPVQLTDAGSRRELPLPEGRTRSQVFDLLSTISIEGAPPTELVGYLTEDFERFLLTWGMVKDDVGTALEIGANPYFTTVLLREFTSLDLTLTNSFDPNATGPYPQKVAYRGADASGVVEHTFVFEALNVESADFPYADASFDLVLFCEVIEHLLMDPVRALLEIKRVLKPEGCLVLTTPNVARLENLARLASGSNLYDPYSGYGPYGRHNREFTRYELVKLLEFCGFDVVDHFTADVHGHASAHFVDVSLLAPLVSGRLEDLGQYMFVRAINTSEPRPGRPSEMYRSMPPETLSSWS